ncbi:glycosyltransferase [Halioglobus maricola]|uniref:Glycosyltransferase n=1 Tax=Halioglobus maricola TaxID=2601894 RepID=A0A5P9NFZ6_9GAMM|nr:glycosyltransferase [Halioglobus maricola]QFU74465.1 glycosyltransferase [Halioglobus maricola]
MTQSRKLVAVIVTFNRLEKLKLTLEKTLENSFFRVVIVNNASTDGTDLWLNSVEDDRLEIIHSEKNLGGAGGFNLGFSYAASNIPEADWLVCFDDDAYPERGATDTFAALDIPDDVGSLAASVYLPDGKRISEMNRPSMNPFWHFREFFGTAGKGRAGFHVDDQAYASKAPLEVDSSSFVGCFIRLENIRSGKIGLPRSELFIYADDIIYVLGSRLAGFRHWFVPTIRFRHDCETLINQRDVYYPLWKVFYTYRNRLELFRIASGVFFPLVLLIKIPGFFLTCRHYPKEERSIFLRLTRNAVWDGLRRNFEKKHSEVVSLATAED